MSEVLTSAIAVCQWFMEQKALEDQAKEGLKDMRENIELLLPVLQDIDPRGLEKASSKAVIANLWHSLDNAKRIYEKYEDGYKFRKFWVTPGCIKEKAERQTKRLHDAFLRLQLVLDVAGHNRMVNQNQPASTAVGHNAKETEKDMSTWEIPFLDIEMNLDRFGLPQTALGVGSFSVVGLGTYTGLKKDGSVEKIQVAVKMPVSNRLAAARQDAAVLREELRSFKEEVKFLCRIDHPHICDCYGAVTKQEGCVCMWIVMELLDINLERAIEEKRLQHGHVAPELFAQIVAGIVSAVAYLHSPINGSRVYNRGSSDLC
jgi:hypothetical protein